MMKGCVARNLETNVFADDAAASEDFFSAVNSAEFATATAVESAVESIRASRAQFAQW
jgi:hypothetical protein